MSSVNNGIRSTLIPCLIYRDAPAAIATLCEVFGFTEKVVIPGENNTVHHAELALGNGMLMLGSVQHQTPFGRLMDAPTAGQTQTQSVYAVVPDPDAVYERVKRAGMAILIEIKDEDYGGRGFTCRDQEGHIWSVGSYDPFA
ncbi:VOC family protein [Massilia sp. PAMC28688]|uniref:VOC family protein n=1 Tax=Massilia sp. PAMC28688 TaxID=2861283 RepID=UPI001C638D1A|nr:VOC family protein [Massilia sp. PAMC28688]QYF94308.1 VOC family protein [Massilia sp. PAMC28688]